MDAGAVGVSAVLGLGEVPVLGLAELLAFRLAEMLAIALLTVLAQPAVRNPTTRMAGRRTRPRV
ncbi:MAG: hypothetical protein ACRDOB_27675 [Streptosporangiaceae bacterium]